MDITFLGAAGEVTGSCYLIKCGGHQILLECGLKQGTPENEKSNRDPFAVGPGSIDAVILSHAHIDHSGRIPLLVKEGFKGPVYATHASKDLCRIMLRDSAFLNEKETQWENKKRQRKGLRQLEPLYSVDDAKRAVRRFKGLGYDEEQEILPGIRVRFRDAGHILGSAIVELTLTEQGVTRKLVFSGDLGHNGAPILRDPTVVRDADLVMLESTYGDRVHRSWTETWQEIREVMNETRKARGNILIPAFAVGRTQEVLYLFGLHFEDWNLENWEIFLDSPMAIEATEVYLRHNDLYDHDAENLWLKHNKSSLLPNLHFSRTANQSMRLNRITRGAIIIAGSGMCTGGRIKHHLKHNIWRQECHVIIVGYQAEGTLGRSLVEGRSHIRIWGETIQVRAKIHTVGGLSAHADQTELVDWYNGFEGRPPVVLVHGEAEAQSTLAAKLRGDLGAQVRVAAAGERMDLVRPGGFE